jgi:hypothetical protein
MSKRVQSPKPKAKSQVQNANAPLAVTSAEQLQALCRKPIVCTFRIDRQAVSVEVQRLSPQAEEAVRAIRREAQPPWNKEQGDYNRLDPKFLNARDNLERIARSLTIYSGCPMVSAGKPGLTNRNDIHAYVQTLFSDTILEIIFLTISGGGIELEDRANFISTPGLES